MYEGATVGVVVPAYNEEGFVGAVIETVPAFVDRVYVVDDASTDGTWEEIQRHAEVTNRRPGRPLSPAADGGVAFEPRVVTIRHEDNRGVGAAIKTGYRRALADGIDVVAVMNGDGQMDPANLDRVVDPIVADEADYAKGDRLETPADRAAMSGWRLFGNGVLTALTRVASGYWGLTDSQNGYTAISREALETLDLDAVHDRYGFCNDVLAHLNVAGMRVADVPMRAIYGDEHSHIRYATFVPELSWLLLRDFLWRLRATYGPGHPVPALYLLGVFAGIVGVLASLGHLAGAVVGWLSRTAARAGADGLFAGVTPDWPTLAVPPGPSAGGPPLLGSALAPLSSAAVSAGLAVVGAVLLAGAALLDCRYNEARGLDP